MLRLTKPAATGSLGRFEQLNEKVNAKIKGTFLEKLVKYSKGVYTDYKEVAVSVKSDIKAKPAKATLLFSGLGFFFYSLTHNPNEKDFRAKFIQCTNEVSLVSPDLVNTDVVEHLTHLQQSFNKDLVRHTNLGVFSLVWIDKYSKDCGTYETNCSYLQLPYKRFASSIIDVGFLNIWWMLSRKMLDYDVNY